jgi:hypothetical protein
MSLLDQIKALRLPAPKEPTIGEARAEWDLTIRGKGGYCPCCDKWGKVYRLGISHSMMKALLWMASNHGENWVDMPKQAPRDLIQTYTFASLKWWRLIERLHIEKEVEVVTNEDTGERELVYADSATKSSGIWRVTPIGMQFAKGLVQVPQYVYLYNDTLKDVSTETVYIKDCVGKKFSYSEIMNATWGGGYDE